MTQHFQRVRSGAAVSQLEEASDILDELDSIDWTHQNTLEIVSRLKSVTKNIYDRLTVADSDLVPGSLIPQLDQMSRYILETARVIRDAGPDARVNTDNVHNQIDAYLGSVSALPMIPIRTTPRVLHGATEQFAREVNSAEAKITNLASDFGSKVESLKADIDEKEREFTGNATDQTSRMEVEFGRLRDSLQNLENRTGEAIEELRTQVTSHQQAFLDAQNQRDEVFRDAQSQRRDQYRAWFEESNDDIRSLQDQARGMLEEVAGASTAAHYVGHSLQQSKTADIWRLIGVGALLAMAVASVWVFYDSSRTEQDFSVAWLVARTGLLGSILIFAAYALRQSSNHRRQAQGMQRLANELQLLWPFMNRLPDEHKEALLLEITPLYFRGQSSNDARLDSQGLARRLLDKLGKLKVEGD